MSVDVGKGAQSVPVRKGESESAETQTAGTNSESRQTEGQRFLRKRQDEERVDSLAQNQQNHLYPWQLYLERVS